jgi:malate synthase
VRGDGRGFSASIVDLTLYLVNNYRRLQDAGSSLALYLPKIQTAEEAALWNDIIAALESHLQIADGSVKVYVLVEQLEACFQLMEIRAALGSHFVGFNTGRWDYINSVADAMAWDPDFIDPNIDAITILYMPTLRDRCGAAIATGSAGTSTLWRGSPTFISSGSALRGWTGARAGARRRAQAARVSPAEMVHRRRWSRWPGQSAGRIPGATAPAEAQLA